MFELFENIKNNRRKPATIALVLLLTLPAIAFVLPTASAHTPPWTIPTYAYVTASPNTVGVGETVVFVMWLQTIPPTATGTGGDRWHGFKLEITAPDGSKTNIGPLDSGSVGTTWATFTPTQVGKYTAVFSWPGQVLQNGTNPNFMGAAYVGDTFSGATSNPATLTVTASPTPLWQEPPIPSTGYWARPMNAQNRQWSQLATNWLGGGWLVGNIMRYGVAPNSPHIVWCEPIAEQPGASSAHPGGISDGQWVGQSFDTDDYQSPWGGSIIMNGIVYYNSPGDALAPKYGYYAVDLRTGTQLWYNNGTFNNVVMGDPSFGSGAALSQTFPRLSFGQLQHYNSVNGQGILAYLWMTQGQNWYMLDPDNGNLLMTLRGVSNPYGSAAASITDQDGNLLIYNVNATTGRLTAWNSTQAIPFGAPGTATSAEQWRIRIGAVIDAQNDKSWTTVPIPGGAANGAWTAADTFHTAYSVNTTIAGWKAGLSWISAPSYAMNFGTARVLQSDDRVPQMLFCFQNPSSQGDVTGGNGTFRAWAAKINYGGPREGPNPTAIGAQSNWNLGTSATLLWSKEYTPPQGGNITWLYGPVDYDSKVFTIYAKETQQWYAYSLDDGSLKWGPTAPESPWQLYGPSSQIMYGNLYSGGYGGIIYCYDINNGNLKWTYEGTNIGGESPYGNYPLNILAIADGKLFLGSSEHSPTKPLWRGSFLRAVDAINGHEVFKIETWVDGLAIADGYIVCANHYSNNIQCFGRGPTATTVSVSSKMVEAGSPVLIDGIVTDQSPGMTQLGIPIKGTPAVSDSYMQQWMEYMFMQQAFPTNAQGVPVTISAVDQNGGVTNIGQATTDLTGLFSFTWTPSATGKYTIVASFDGSNSYFASAAECAVGVSTAAGATPTPTAAPTQAGAVNVVPLETFYAFAIVIVILIIVAIAAIFLRKK